MRVKNFQKLFASIILCEGVAVIGSLITLPAINTWYQTITKPSFNPPNWIFGPVWTTLFLLMGISLYLIWVKGIKNKVARKAVWLFLIQLLLNFLWSLFFFGFHSPLLALIDIVLLWIIILLTIIEFNKISRPASLLLVPYILWVSFAFILNLFIVLLN